MAEGNLVGTTVTKVREDFSAAGQSRLWETRKEGAGMTVDWNTASALRILTGTTANQETVLRYAEPLETPVRVMFLSLAAQLLSQRIANQEFELRLVSDDGTEYVSWLLDGTVATSSKLRSANGGVAAADAAATIPDTGTGSVVLELESWNDECYWHARTADSLSARANSYVRNRRIPNPNARLFVEIAVRNLATAPASSTTLQLDAITIQDVTELSVEVTGGRGGGSASQSVPVSVIGALGISSLTPGTSATQLGKSEDAVHASGDVGIEVLGVRQATTPVALTTAAGDYSALLTDAEGKLITANEADPVHTVQAVLDATLASSVAIVAAGAAGVRLYVTDLAFENTGAAANRVIVYDGATRIFSATVQPGQTFDKSFITPLKGTAATALNVALGVAGTVTISVSGYRGI